MCHKAAPNAMQRLALDHSREHKKLVVTPVDAFYVEKWTKGVRSPGYGQKGVHRICVQGITTRRLLLVVTSTQHERIVCLADCPAH